LYDYSNNFMPVGFTGIMFTKWNLRVPSDLIKNTSQIEYKTLKGNRLVMVGWIELMDKSILTEMKS
jgi:hypothetical protein